jgi:hypothetical protein
VFCKVWAAFTHDSEAVFILLSVDFLVWVEFRLTAKVRRYRVAQWQTRQVFTLMSSSVNP